MITLIGIAQAIKDGDTTVEDAFKSKSKDTKTSATETKEVEKIEVKVTDALKEKQSKKSDKDELPLQ